MKDLTSEIFNFLIVKSFAHRKGKHYFWNCQCKCGVITVVRSDKLKSGHTKSCGCLNYRCNGMSGTRFHNNWNSMKQRCFDENHKAYKFYGAKGITVCERWLDFQNFRKDMYESFLSFEEENGFGSASIERLDVNKSYNPDNCTWIKINDQQKNKSNSRRIEYKGEVYSIDELVEKYNLNYHAFIGRENLGWDIERILNTPLREDKRRG